MVLNEVGSDHQNRPNVLLIFLSFLPIYFDINIIKPNYICFLSILGYNNPLQGVMIMEEQNVSAIYNDMWNRSITGLKIINLNLILF
ncbi:hypothetical protein COE25_09965 [Bacillus sp. AFS031507]|nr:hypothetical protein COE25_09965 [Bacillus sp. AFS031507]